jgi:eukaryotic-like serine/threonine-protein kinase
MALSEGDVIDEKYRILRLLGKGGMGTVWVAENLRVRRQVAIKVLLRSAAEAAGDALLRFEREAQAAGQIGSDHIVEVLDLGTTADGDRFMVMEYLEGDTLKQRMRRGRLEPQKTAAVFCQLLEGLTAAHAAGIVHRDIKPDNIFLQKEKAGHRDWVKILDFGISKFSQLSGEEGQVTRAGMVMGTPFYMSPEQARTAHAVDTRSDLYSVAVMLFETLTGQVPFSGTTFAELLFKIAFEPQPHPKTVMPTLDDEICAIILRGMERDPAARFQTAGEFAEALKAWDSRRDAMPSRAQQMMTMPLPQRPPQPEAVTSHGLLAPPPPAPAPAPVNSPTLAFPPAPAPVPAALAEGVTQSWAGGSITSPTIDPNAQPDSPGITQKSWDGTVPTPALPMAKSLAPVIVGAVMTVGAAAAIAIFLLTRPGPVAPTEAGSGVAVTTASAAPLPSAAPIPPPPVEASASPIATQAPTATASAAPVKTSTPTVATPRVPTSAAPGGKKKNGQVVTDYGY